jgi:radical SAM superfamily enzyme YgiQ (UPF0313 family)
MIIPPARRGWTNERDQNAGVGVSRRLKWREGWSPNQPPIDMLYLGAAAERDGMRVQLIDLMVERLEGQRAVQFVSDHITGSQEKLWIAVRLSMPTLPLDLAFANGIKAQFPQARVFGIGGMIMGTYRHWIDQCRLDFLVYGDIEAVVPQVMSAPDWRRAPGIIVVQDYRPDGKDPFDPTTAEDYRHWARSQNIGAIERPAWHLVPLQRYTGSGDARDAVGIVHASRGCPINCTMCTYAMVDGAPLRTSDPVRVVDEIAYLRDTYGITRIRFEDPNFAYDRRLVKAVVAELKRRQMSIDGSAELSLEMLDRPTLEGMADVGIRTILTGIETNDAACLKSIGQNIKVNPLIKQKLTWCAELGLKVYGFFLIGAPEESWDTLRNTIAFAKGLGCECTTTVMTPFPGTPLYWRALRENLLPKEMIYERWGSYTATVRTYHLTLRDLQVARLWVRLETIIPYRLAEARRGVGPSPWRVRLRHAPHYAVRQMLRTYVWWRSTVRPSLMRPLQNSELPITSSVEGASRSSSN